MKILNIHFKNINSLEGESRVSFDQPPLVDAGVFAITGPNGSGKSSILDAITLGLYGETFKFDRPSAHVMTRQTSECFSVVEFAIDSVQYRSTWRVEREQGNAEGALMPPHMQLTRLNGSEQLLVEQPNKVRDMIAKVTGMDFRCFTRSILLAQGDFASFLNALDNERLDIMEKIIGADVYEKYKTDLLGITHTAKSELEQIKGKIAAMPVIDPSKIDACEQDLADFQEQHDDFKDEKISLTQQQNWLNNLIVLQRNISALEQSEQSSFSRAEKVKADLERIAANQGILKYQAEMGRINEKEQQAEQQKKTLSAFYDERDGLKNNLKSVGYEADSANPPTQLSIREQKQNIDTLKLQIVQIRQDKQSEIALRQTLDTQLGEKQAVLQSVKDWLQEHAVENFLLNDYPDIAKFKRQQAELKSLQTNHKTLQKLHKTLASTHTKNSAAIEKANKELVYFNSKMDNAEDELQASTQGNKSAEVIELRKHRQERVEQFKELLNLASRHAKMSNGNGILNRLLVSYHFVGDHVTDDFAIVVEELKREKNILNALTKAVNFEGLLRKHEEERETLEDGQPCPLCGSLSHPYSNRLLHVDDSTKAFHDQQRKVKIIQAEADKLEKQVKAGHKQSDLKEEQEAEVVRIRSQWLLLCSRLNQVRVDLDISDISFMKKLLQQEQDELSTIMGLEKDYYRCQSNIDKLKQQIKQQEGIKERVQGDNEKLQQELQNLPQQLQHLDQRQSKLEKEMQALADKLTGQLDKLGEKLPWKGKGDVLQSKLQQLRQDYQAKFLQHKALQDEIEALSEKAETSRSSSDELDLRIDDFTAQLQQEETSGLHLSLVEKQKLIAAAEKQRDDMASECHELQQALLKKIPQYESLAEIREILSLLSQQEQLEQQQLSVDNELENLSIELNKAQAQLEAEKASAMTKLSLEDVVVKLHGVTEKMDIAAHEIVRLEKLLQEQRALLDVNTKLSHQLEKQQKAYDVLVAENKLMEQNGVNFRRRVQRMMADKLLKRANQYLEKISGRYFLRQGEKAQGVILEIEDSQRNNTHRLPKTLSGGESFVVSLALALALSEMASNGRSLDSLFLDEGFGNLDEESLYLVVSTLKSLQQQGKSVGVISHIKGVKERIETQIEMTKQDNGVSTLTLVS